MYLFEPKPEWDSPAQDCDNKESKDVFRCAVCSTKITHRKYFVCIDADSPFHSFLNPAGFHFDVVTFSRCQSLVDVPPSTEKHSWFPGYTWKIIGCAGCQQHLGWCFERKQKPQKFFGLICERLKEGE